MIWNNTRSGTDEPFGGVTKQNCLHICSQTVLIIVNKHQSKMHLLNWHSFTIRTQKLETDEPFGGNYVTPFIHAHIETKKYSNIILQSNFFFFLPFPFKLTTNSIIHELCFQNLKLVGFRKNDRHLYYQLCLIALKTVCISILFIWSLLHIQPYR